MPQQFNPKEQHHPGREPHGPWEHDLKFRTSKNLGPWSEPKTLVEAAGVPSAIRDKKGRLYLAFQWFPQDESMSKYFDRVAVIISDDDGKTWSKPTPIKIKNFPENYQRPFDPTLALTDDGRIRLYFSSSPGGSQMVTNDVGTYSAISEDGIHYEFEPGARFTVEDNRVIDPAVLKFGDTWHLLSPIGRPEAGAYHAVSKDGLSFTRCADIPSSKGQNWTGNLFSKEQGIWFYGSGPKGIWFAFSKDGYIWGPPSLTGIKGGDPTVVTNRDNLAFIIYVSHSQDPTRHNQRFRK